MNFWCDQGWFWGQERAKSELIKINESWERVFEQLSEQFDKRMPSVLWVNELSRRHKNKIASLIMTEQAGNMILFLFQSKQICLCLMHIECMCFRLKNKFKAEKRLCRYCAHVKTKFMLLAQKLGVALLLHYRVILHCQSPNPKA